MAISKVERFMDKYVLYLDESHIRGDYSCVGGVIVKESEVALISADLDKLKQALWASDPHPEQYILHEKEISEAKKYGSVSQPCYNIFRSNRNYNKLYAGLAKIMKRYNISTLGTCVDISSLKNKYPGEVNSNLTIALQMLLENYCHFLTTSNAYGDVCYESLQEPGNTPLRQRFYELQALGTMYYTSHTFQTHIGDIKFCDKNENIAGLQLADFIPNTYARFVAEKKPKHDDFKKAVIKKAYDGKIGDPAKYGLKKIP